MGTIYKITNTVNSKIYVGATNLSIHERKMVHLYALRQGKHANKHLQIEFLTHGEQAFEFEVLQQIPGNIWDYQQLEVEFIKNLNTQNRDIGYNISSGGRGGFSVGNRPVKCLNTGKVYHTATSAGKQLGISSTTIRKICLNIKQEYLGFRFSYVS